MQGYYFCFCCKGILIHVFFRTCGTTENYQTDTVQQTNIPIRILSFCARIDDTQIEVHKVDTLLEMYLSPLMNKRKPKYDVGLKLDEVVNNLA
jgi:hypothetical protein